MLSTFIITVNLIWIFFGLPEPTKHVREMHQEVADFHYSSKILFFLGLSLFTTIGFSVIQSGSAQFTTDRFGFNADYRGYTMAVVGIVSILFQGFLVKYVRKYLKETQMMTVGLSLLTWDVSLRDKSNCSPRVFYSDTLSSGDGDV
jgi:predicted MFS family arabinose efflux permease